MYIISAFENGNRIKTKWIGTQTVEAVNSYFSHNLEWDLHGNPRVGYNIYDDNDNILETIID